MGVFRRLSDCVYELPKTAGMLVPGRVYASEAMLPKLERERVAEQVANVACLPGIVEASLAMPDAHWGYGFPVGGVAAMDTETGVISPGGVGYDISCLPPESKVLHEHGYFRPIKDMAADWRESRILCQDFDGKRSPGAGLIRFFRKKPDHPAYALTTHTGRTLIATADHPIYTPRGMRRVQDIVPEDKVALFPFQGVPFEEPSSGILVSVESFSAFLTLHGKGERGNAFWQILNQLLKRNLLPLRRNSLALPYILKLMGYGMGDGTLTRFKDGSLALGFYGKKQDLEDIRKDVEAIGFSAIRVHSRERRHYIRTHYAGYRFGTTENMTRCGSSALALLLAALGCPIGNKADQEYRIPSVVMDAPLWQKRLFLSAFFGAEMSAPKAMGRRNFYCPMISASKRLDLVENAGEFLGDIGRLLGEFGVGMQAVSRVHDDYLGAQGRRSARYRLVLSSRPESLLALYEKVGFSYNREKMALGLAAAQYLRAKSRAAERRQEVAVESLRIHRETDLGAKSIHKVLGGPSDIALRFIQRSIYEGRRSPVRIWDDFPSFDEFLTEATAGLGTGAIWDFIASKTKARAPAWVYDFTVDHPAHNFVADGFVVSNCGVRLLRSDLEARTVRSKAGPLMDRLYSSVPSGVGKSGRIRLGKEDLRQVLRKGARWAVENGHGEAEDLSACEDGGRLEEAEPEEVGERALDRGRDQLGTLGSGNHFLELQEVSDIFEPGIAAVFGLFKGQLVVSIHTGSRGLGYQVCDDFLRVAQKAAARHGISLPDRQLACAPFDSEEGRRYFGAMCAAANFARANRQAITQLARDCFMRELDLSPRELGMRVVYDVCHNIAKVETHRVQGRAVRVCVHRKGATRAFPAGHPEVPQAYRGVGQPVLVPGSMGTESYVLVGTQGAMDASFGSVCHGAGRRMSRTQASKRVQGHELSRELGAQGIQVRTDSYRGLAEEAPFAYKDVSEVVEVCERAGLSRKVARLKPLGVLKG